MKYQYFYSCYALLKNTHSMKYIWYSPIKLNILYVLLKEFEQNWETLLWVLSYLYPGCFSFDFFSEIIGYNND